VVAQVRQRVGRDAALAERRRSRRPARAHAVANESLKPGAPAHEREDPGIGDLRVVRDVEVQQIGAAR